MHVQLACCPEHPAVSSACSRKLSQISSRPAYTLCKRTSSTTVDMLLPQPVPSPRGQHTAVFDGDDQLIVFGGVDTKEAYAAPTVHVLSLSQRRWFSPAVAGEGPGQRARHCAAMLGQNGMRTMAVFGGRCPTVRLFEGLGELLVPMAHAACALK